MKKAAFSVGLFLLAFAVPVTVYTLVSRSQNFDVQEEAAEEDDNVSIPQIVSVPVTEVDADQKYTYRIKTVDNDGDEVSIEIKEKPDWLSWDEDLDVLSGFPGEDDIGSHDVEIVVTDEKWRNNQKFSISVVGEESEEFDTAPAETEEIDTTEDSAEESEDEAQVAQPSDEEYEDHGLEPISQANSDGGELDNGGSQGSVLGAADATLPNTASFTSVIGLSFGFAVLSVAFFLWADSRWGIIDGLSKNVSLKNGKQISMVTEDGWVVKKKRTKK